MKEDIVLTISQLSKTYGKKQVLHPVDLKVKRGECVVLCGGNGAGKSTLIKMITGIEKQSTGKFTFKVDNKKKFGFMPDAMDFPGELTAIEVLKYYGKFLNASEDKINELLKRVGLWDVRNQKVGSFSKGMSQRVNLAQTLLADVDVYILDEPTNGLDPYWVIEFKEIIHDLKREGKTILLSSHIMRDVAEISDRVVILFEGAIKEDGSLEEIYARNNCESLEEVFLKLLKLQTNQSVLRKTLEYDAG
ncbi:ABC transporter ATP-binding protein [Ornithinibacillus halophilus]|uniref:ABC-2 type transport system ATP-binding protein n=1 Tax=Ornithinibacillus halophilus TaxID=930117 RepID=A0A1M5FB47_9BACI|nr:ABC transporter ATP-binding protein [Ornithinibacillus halophilus]SHF88669.1 ABC-2 type transport system ATP-binding protein [Ornithinibacillus halophilus]